MSGTLFGHYELLGLLGRGGMGEVFRAFDREQDRVVALKLLPASMAADEGFVERFKRESYAAAQLNDPHVVPIHRYGEIDGRLYIDMRLVDGMDLAKLIGRDGPLAAARAISIITQTAEALDAAHAANLVHRDVKPSNLLVTAQDFVYLVDFGIAHVMGLATTGKALTATGATIGTLDYMAPERFDATGEVDARADVYSLACLLYECLTAQRPFPVDGLPALLNAHLHTPPPAVTALRPDLPAALDAVIARGMAKDPDARYPTAGQLAADLAAAVHGSGPARAPSTASAAIPPVAAAASAPATHVAPPGMPRPAFPPGGHQGPPNPYPPPPHPGGYGYAYQPGPYPPPRRRGVNPAWLVAAASLLGVAVLVGVLLGRPNADADPADPVAAGPSPAATAAQDPGGNPTSVPAPTPGSTGSATVGPAGSAPAPTGSAPAPTGSAPAPTVAPTPGDLGLAMPISQPACTGLYVTFVGSVTDPSRYRTRVDELLNAYPGSTYLLTEQTGCSSLRARNEAGQSIYAVFYGTFDTLAQACAARARAGGDSYVKRLDNQTPPSELLTC